MSDQHTIGIRPTIVTFPGGGLQGNGTILYCDSVPSNPDKSMIVVDKTPFHPVDYKWPDQPGDRGHMLIKNVRVPIQDCMTVIFDKTLNQILLDQEIKSLQQDAESVLCVAHIVPTYDIQKLGEIIGSTAECYVDEEYRHALSLGHSCCHVVALALNKALKDYWRKDVATDSLGNPNFDKLAITESRVIEHGSHDKYRVGKSLRKKGFESAKFFAEIEQVTEKVNNQIDQWLAESIKIHVEPGEAFLNDNRTWHCDLKDGHAEIPCGGTHVTLLDASQHVDITIEQHNEEPEFIVKTTVTSQN